MRFVQIISISAFLLSSAQAMAEPHHGHGACAPYFATCKNDPSVKAADAGTDKKAKWEVMNSCIAKAAAADGDKGKACQDAQAKMEKMYMMHKDAAPGAANTAPGAPAAAPTGN